MGPRVLGALILFAIACGGSNRPSTDPPVPDPPPAPVGETDCERAQHRLDALECAHRRTPKGASFQEACDAAARDGRNWRSDCIALVTSCDDVEKAFRTPKEQACLPQD